MTAYKKYQNTYITAMTLQIAYPGPGLTWRLLHAHAPSTIAKAMLSVARTQNKHQSCAIIRDTHATYGLYHDR